MKDHQTAPTEGISKRLGKILPLIVVLAVAFRFSPAQSRGEDSAKVSSQNPSPMTESARRHARIEQKEYAGTAFQIRGMFSKPVNVFVPKRSVKSHTFDVMIHFHGAAYVTQYAAVRYTGNLIAAELSVGSGSKVYNDAFRDTTQFSAILDSIVTETARQLGHKIRVGRVILSGFSAGYGAIRRILSTETNYKRVDAVLLLDGIHTSYIPERKVLADGGRIDSTGLFPFLKFARDASLKKSKKQFLISHSEIFPGTFVSTTESTDYLLQSLSMSRVPVLHWGPLGMQQISASRSNHFAVWGFAGNSGRDHVDHLQGLYWFLNRLMSL